LIEGAARLEVDSPQTGRKLISAILACIAAVVVVLGIIGAGQWMIRTTLAEQARATAEAWYRAAMHSARGDVDRLIRNMVDRADNYERDALRSAGIDAVVALGPVIGAKPIVESGTARIEVLFEAIGASAGSDLAKLPSGSYPIADFGWLKPRTYQSWVLLPATGPSRTRLAAYADQTTEALQLTFDFLRQTIYTLGTALIAFFAFMAGYTYRAQHLLKDNEELRRVALYDELTGLPNRKQFEAVSSEAIKAVSKGRGRAAVMLLDLDGFKAVNDTLGHQAGDKLLKATAQRLSAALRERDVLARLSGDEFAIVVPSFSEVSQISAIAERIQIAMSQAFQIDSQKVTVGCSIGVAVAPENGDTAEALFRNADFALYRAKESGKRTWRFFDPNMAEELHRRLSIEDGLRASLDRDMFTIVYQPQVNLLTGEIDGYEALLRWRLPGQRMATTASFLRIAEETGLIIPIGENVIRQAAQDCALLPENVRIAVNLSPAQLKREDIADLIKSAFEEHSVDPRRLDVEVNEAILGRDEATAIAGLERIRALGVSIVLDDFRSSSFGLLTRAPFDKLKLSGKFLAGIEEDAKSRAIVAAICNLGRSLEMEVAAQGVEGAELAASLPLLGCTRAQGNFFGEPRPMSQYLALAAHDEEVIEQVETVEGLDPDIIRQPSTSEVSDRLAEVA
jgi:diguanylate cyclase (GGDEF)-like protein